MTCAVHDDTFSAGHAMGRKKKHRPEDHSYNPRAGTGSSNKGGGRAGVAGATARQCYHCGEEGHLSRDCKVAAAADEAKKLQRYGRAPLAKGTAPTHEKADSSGRGGGRGGGDRGRGRGGGSDRGRGGAAGRGAGRPRGGALSKLAVAPAAKAAAAALPPHVQKQRRQTAAAEKAAAQQADSPDSDSGSDSGSDSDSDGSGGEPAATSSEAEAEAEPAPAAHNKMKMPVAAAPMPEAGVKRPAGKAAKTVERGKGQKKRAREERPLWKAVADPESGSTYWYNRETRDTTWTDPSQ